MNDLYGPGLEICFLCSWAGLLWEMHVCVVGKRMCAAGARTASSYLLLRTGLFLARRDSVVALLVPPVRLRCWRGAEG